MHHARTLPYYSRRKIAPFPKPVLVRLLAAVHPVVGAHGIPRRYSHWTQPVENSHPQHVYPTNLVAESFRNLKASLALGEWHSTLASGQLCRLTVCLTLLPLNSHRPSERFKVIRDWSRCIAQYAAYSSLNVGKTPSIEVQAGRLPAADQIKAVDECIVQPGHSNVAARCVYNCCATRTAHLTSYTSRHTRRP
jgi:hypothetical protein